jgi:hypothetical protein
VAVTGGAQRDVGDALEMVRRRGGLVRAWVVEPGARRAPRQFAGRAQGAYEQFMDLDGPVQHVGTEWPL